MPQSVQTRSPLTKRSQRALMSWIPLAVMYCSTTSAFQLPSSSRRQQGPSSARRQLVSTLIPFSRQRVRSIGQSQRTLPTSSTTRPVVTSWSSSSNDGLTDEAFSSLYYGGGFQDTDDGVLSYLPDNGANLPPKTKQLLKRVTAEYRYGTGNRPPLELENVLAVIDEEYDLLEDPPVIMNVGNHTFACEQGQDHTDLIVIVSFAVHHQLPAEITLQFMTSAVDRPTDSVYARFRSTFESDGWQSVSFPQGLGLRVKEKVARMSHLSSNNLEGRNFFPPSRIPWRSRSTRKAAEAAELGIQLAARTVAPEQNIMTPDEFLIEIEAEMRLSKLATLQVDEQPNILTDTPLPSFPSSNTVYDLAWRKVKRALMRPTQVVTNNKAWRKSKHLFDTQYAKMKQAGRAGIFAYAFINFLLYTVGVSWQWRRLPVELVIPDGATAMSLAVKKLGTAFARVYVGASLFKLVRIFAALALAPAAGRVLQATQRKLGVSENAAFAIWITLLIKTFFGAIAVSILSESALRKTMEAQVIPESLLHKVVPMFSGPEAI